MSLELYREYSSPSEEADMKELTELTLRTLRIKYVQGPQQRDTHAKGLATVKGTFTIEPNLPEELRVGEEAHARGDLARLGGKFLGLAGQGLFQHLAHQLDAGELLTDAVVQVLPEPDALLERLREQVPLHLRILLGAAALAALIATAGSSPASAQQDFYRGRTLNLYVGFAPGGSYDLYGRLIANHYGRFIPGNPTMIAQNMPGAAGATATFHVMNVGAKDGTVLGAIHPGNIIEPIFGDKRKVRYDPGAFQYIGNANNDVYVCYARMDAPAKSFEEAMTKELIIGSSGEGASTRDFPLLLNRVLGTKFKVLLGYSGNREVQLAIERGEPSWQTRSTSPISMPSSSALVDTTPRTWPATAAAKSSPSPARSSGARSRLLLGRHAFGCGKSFAPAATFPYRCRSSLGC